MADYLAVGCCGFVPIAVLRVAKPPRIGLISLLLILGFYCCNNGFLYSPTPRVTLALTTLDSNLIGASCSFLLALPDGCWEQHPEETAQVCPQPSPQWLLHAECGGRLRWRWPWPEQASLEQVALHCALLPSCFPHRCQLLHCTKKCLCAASCSGSRGGRRVARCAPVSSDLLVFPQRELLQGHSSTATASPVGAHPHYGCVSRRERSSTRQVPLRRVGVAHPQLRPAPPENGLAVVRLAGQHLRRE